LFLKIAIAQDTRTRKMEPKMETIGRIGIDGCDHPRRRKGDTKIRPYFHFSHDKKIPFFLFLIGEKKPQQQHTRNTITTISIDIAKERLARRPRRIFHISHQPSTRTLLIKILNKESLFFFHSISFGIFMLSNITKGITIR